MNVSELLEKLCEITLKVTLEIERDAPRKCFTLITSRSKIGRNVDLCMCFFEQDKFECKEYVEIVKNFIDIPMSSENNCKTYEQ